MREVEGTEVGRRIRAPWLELVATYGEPTDLRRRNLRLWREFRRDAATDGTAGWALAGQIVESSIAYVWHRIRRGEPTAVPAGILLTLTSLATLLFLLAPSDPLPARVQLHIAAGLVCFGAVLVRWPQWQPPRELAFTGFVLGSGMAHALSELETSHYPLSTLIVIGIVCVALGAVALGAFWASDFLSLRRRGLELLAIGGFLVAIGDLNLSAASNDPRLAAASIFSSAFAALTANCLLRLRSQQPPLAGQAGGSSPW